MVSHLLGHLNLTLPTRLDRKSAKDKRPVNVSYSRMFGVQCMLNPLSVDMSFVVLYAPRINQVLSLL